MLGRGITNSRSNYDTAAAIAKQEALVNSRFHLFRQALGSTSALNGALDEFLGAAGARLPLEQYLEQLADLEDTCQRSLADGALRRRAAAVGEALTEVFKRLQAEAPLLFAPGAKRKSRLLPRHRRQPVPGHRRSGGQGSRHPLRLPAQRVRPLDHRSREPRLWRLDQAPPAGGAGAHLHRAARDRGTRARRCEAPIKGILDTELEETYVVGTGYGRARLPFSKEHIRSRDPVPRPGRARDVPGHRHRARHRRPGHQGDPGRPGRHRRELPDERPLRRRLRALPRLHRRRDEHGPARARAAGDEVDQDVRINSTCTVFAGAELRDRLSLGDKREDIMAGLHRAIILRAMSILARSGGVRNEFTFTGGVAKNEAAVKALKDLVTRELRRAEAQHRPRLDLHRRARRRHLRLARGGGGRQDGGGEGMNMIGARPLRGDHRRYVGGPRARGSMRSIHTIGIDIGSGAVKIGAVLVRRRRASRHGSPSAASASAGATR